MNPIGLQGGLLHIFNHALMKCALFMSVGCILIRRVYLILTTSRVGV